MSVHAGWPVGQAVGWTGDGWARMADADWGAALRPWRGPIVVRWGEAQEESDEVPALDRPVRIPSTGRTVTLRALFAALRANGVVPHAHGEAEDERIAAGMVARALPRARPSTGLESDVRPLPWIGAAEGTYPRTAVATPEGAAELEARLAEDSTYLFQGDAIALTGSYDSMVADMASMGAGRLRRVKQSDIYYGAVFPESELAAELFAYGSQVPPPRKMLDLMEAPDASGAGFARLAATTAMICECLCQGVKLDLTPFNGGGGMDQNHTAGSDEGEGDNIPAVLGDGGVPWRAVRAAAPDWQTGFLVQSVEGWDFYYWGFTSDPDSTLPTPTEAERTYQRYVLNVWPTDTAALPARSGWSEYMVECARRKCLGVAAFAWGIGEWLRRIDLALCACGGGRLLNVVDTIELSNELDSFWALYPVGGGAAGSEVERGAFEAGRFMALLAGPILANVPFMRFRHELATWSAVDLSGVGAGPWTTTLDAKCLWFRDVLDKGFRAEAAWWRDLDAGRLVARRGGRVSPEVEAWFRAEDVGGFAWPKDGARVPIPAPWALLHEVGLHWYHVDHDADGGALVQNYCDSVLLAQNMKDLADAVRLMGFSLDVTACESGFPALDPGPGQSNWSHYYEFASEKLQAAMHVRLLATLLATGVRATSIYTFAFGAARTSTGWGDAPVFGGWAGFSTMGLHNDVLYDAGAPRAAYTQADDCWPRPAWYSFRRFCWLLRHAGPEGRAGVSFVYNKRGITIVEVRFATPLALGPDGAALAHPWARAYVVWYDQYADDKHLHPQRVDRRSGDATVRFVHVPSPEEPPSPPGYEILPLVPSVDPTRMTGTSPEGYPVPTVTWLADYAADALVSATPTLSRRHPPVSGGGEWRVFVSALDVVVQACTPALSVAIAPLCILTTLEFEGVS